MVTLTVRSCVARQEPYIPGALSILQGTVPGQVRGLGHMVPTYFRRELRDRALQRPSRLRTLFFVGPDGAYFTSPRRRSKESPRQTQGLLRRGFLFRQGSEGFFHFGGRVLWAPFFAGTTRWE